MANIFLDANEIFPLAASNSTVFGRSGGDERLRIFDGVTGVTTDANIDGIDLSGNLSDHRFAATANGLEISRDGGVIATVPSINNADGIELRAGDGNVMVSQSGASAFTAMNASGQEQVIDDAAAVSLTVPAGGSGIGSPGDAGDTPATGGAVELASTANANAEGGAFVFTDTQLPDNPDGAAVQTEIQNFGADDEIQITQVADESDVQITSLTSGDGETSFGYTSPEGTVFDVTLVGVSGSNFFTVGDFNSDPNLGDVIVA